MSKGKEVYSTPSSTSTQLQMEEEEEWMKSYGGGSGWIEPKTSCDHLDSLSSDLHHIPTPDTHCLRECDHPAENWTCLSCKEVLCSRFINKHMLEHYELKGHCLALSFSDLSVWCFNCEAYLDAQLMPKLRPAYETAYLIKFGELPPVRTVECMQLEDIGTGNSRPQS